MTRTGSLDYNKLLARSSMLDYKDLLEKGLKDLPKHSQNKERFEIPKIEGHFEGKKTILTIF